MSANDPLRADELGEQDHEEALFRAHEQLLKELTAALCVPDEKLVRAILALLAVLREAPTVQVLHRLLKRSHPDGSPATPRDLCDFLTRSRLVELCRPDINPDLR